MEKNDGSIWDQPERRIQGAIIRLRKGDRRGAEEILEKALAVPSISQRDRIEIESTLQAYRAGWTDSAEGAKQAKP